LTPFTFTVDFSLEFLFGGEVCWFCVPYRGEVGTNMTVDFFEILMKSWGWGSFPNSARTGVFCLSAEMETACPVLPDLPAPTIGNISVFL
jgi:hypothetical protein